MRRIVLAAALLLPGCQNLVGPFAHRTPQRVDDPMLPIDEQQRRGRDRLALPETSVAPPSGLEWPQLRGSDQRGGVPGVPP